MPAASACAGDEGAPPPVAFLHGVASGDPRDDRVVLWTRVTTTVPGPIEVQFYVYGDPARAHIVTEGRASTDAQRDYTLKVDVTGLSAGTTYYYEFLALGMRSPVGRTRTSAPQTHVRFAVATCSDYESGWFHAYARMAERGDLDAVLHLGDYLYESPASTPLRSRGMDHEAVSLDDYRALHARYRLDPELQEAHRQHPWIAVWDDHEFSNDAYRDGAEGHATASEGTWATRKEAARRAYLEWLPVREPNGTNRPTYRSFSWGTLVDLFMLDTRIDGRDAQVTGPTDPARTDPSRTMLGPEQETWLETGLRASPATWKVLGNQVMLGHLTESRFENGVRVPEERWMDQWDGYPAARTRLYNVLEGDETHAPIAGVVVCTGDWHNSFALDLPREPRVGYDPASGKGSLGVEWVVPSVTSPFFEVDEEGLRAFSPHIKHHNDSHHGYLIVDITPERIVFEEWYVPIESAEGGREELGMRMQTLRGSNHLSTG